MEISLDIFWLKTIWTFPLGVLGMGWWLAVRGRVASFFVGPGPRGIHIVSQARVQVGQLFCNYRVFFDWFRLKTSKCQSVDKFWHFVDGIYYVICHLELFERNQ